MPPPLPLRAQMSPSVVIFLQIIACTIVHFLHFHLFEGDKLLVCGVPDKAKIYLFLVLEPARVFFSRTWVVCCISCPIVIAPAKTWTRIRHLLNGQGKGGQRTQTGEKRRAAAHRHSSVWNECWSSATELYQNKILQIKHWNSTKASKPLWGLKLVWHHG